ncbi:hypothetical protein Tco_1316395 [Tanacetum coccineum]
MKRTLERRISNSKRLSSAGGGSTSSTRLAGQGDVSDVVADDMTLDLNIHSLLRTSNKSWLEHEADVVVKPQVDATEVETNTLQTRRGPNATETRLAHPSQWKEIGGMFTLPDQAVVNGHLLKTGRENTLLLNEQHRSSHNEH